MRLRWTEEAANDLGRIADYLVQNPPGRAQGLIERIYDAAGSLLTLPHGYEIRIYTLEHAPPHVQRRESWRGREA